MRKLHTSALVVVLLSSLLACGRPEPSGLYPPIEPLQSGHLKVSETHEIYWETVGNPDGIPVIVLHGGPGGSAGPEMRRFFDPDRFHIVLFDQRGAYRSKPRGEWRDNTTRDLVEDINRLRRHLGIDGPAILFGGSWGTTLALAYAEQYPDLVGGMVLRGVFLGTRDEIDYLYHGGAAAFFPDNWDRLKHVVPEPEVPDYPRQLFEMITGDDPEERETAIEGWAYYEIRMSSIGMTDEAAEDVLEQYEDYLMPFATLENYYMMNGCFLGENQLLQHADRIAHIPTFIVHGRYDAVCAPNNAWRLAENLDQVELQLTPAGHSQNEPANVEALLRGVEWVAERFVSSSTTE
jgi:proline iminopeptidase